MLIAPTFNNPRGPRGPRGQSLRPMNDTPYDIREVKPNSFIFRVDNAIPASVCEEAVARFEACPEKHYQGRMGAAMSVEESIKRSTDLRITGLAEWNDIDQVFMQSLNKAVSQLSGAFPFFAVNKFHDMGYQIQRTREGEFYHWHIDGGPGEFNQRQLVAIWYLNNVPGPGGSTDFMVQEVSIQPTRGTLVLFPPFWTHIHRNSTLERGVKYIATTWVCFDEKQ